MSRGQVLQVVEHAEQKDDVVGFYVEHLAAGYGLAASAAAGPKARYEETTSRRTTAAK
jgi:hypothetical protein